MPRRFKRTTQPAYDQSPYQSCILESDFCFRGMNVDVYAFRRNIKEQCDHGVTVPREKILISATDGPDEQTILYRSSIYKQVLRARVSPVERRYTGIAA